MICMGNWSGHDTEESFIKMLKSEKYYSVGDDLNGKQLLAAGYWTGDYEGEMWMLARDTETGDLWEAVEGHCSCNGILEGGIGWSTVLKEQLLNRGLTNRRSFGGNATEAAAIQALVESL